LPETHRIEEQLRASFRGNAWHGPALEDLLHDISYEQAAEQPLPNTHNIWEIVLHITMWYDVVNRRLLGEAVEPTDDEDWPQVPDPDAAAWTMALGSMEAAHERLRGTILALDPARLDEPVRGKPYSVYFMLHGLIQHNLYHAGQIAILKKAEVL
jgi:uncharacterized damage-inducible protein DinB